MQKYEQLLDFHIDKGTNVIPLNEMQTFFANLEYGSQHRIYYLLLSLSLRASEPLGLTWDNFFQNETLLVFRPPKQEKLLKQNGKTAAIRKIKIPPAMAEELRHYKQNNIFPYKRLFTIKAVSTRQYMNQVIRKRLMGLWQSKSGNLRQGATSEYYYFTAQSFRTTAATLVYYYYSLAYPHMALEMTSKFMTHSSEKITASYYIQRVSRLNVDKFPKNLSYLDLMDYVIYNVVQKQLSDFKQPQTNLIEFADECCP